MPTVYEPQPLTLRTADADTSQVPERPINVPDAPAIGFFGRDEALLALDRAFDTDRIVLLHALAGRARPTPAACSRTPHCGRLAGRAWNAWDVREDRAERWGVLCVGRIAAAVPSAAALS